MRGKNGSLLSSFLSKHIDNMPIYVNNSKRNTFFYLFILHKLLWFVTLQGAPPYIQNGDTEVTLGEQLNFINGVQANPTVLSTSRCYPIRLPYSFW